MKKFLFFFLILFSNQSKTIQVSKDAFAEKVRKIIANNENVNVTGEDGCPLLTKAIDYQDLNLIKELLQVRNIDLNIKDRSLSTPLIYACKKNYSEIVQLLLQAGADPNIFDINLYTPLIWSAFYTHKECVKILLNYIKDKKDINKKNNMGNTALLQACCPRKNLDFEIIEMLIDNGSGVNIKNKEDFNPLTLIVSASYTDNYIDVILKIIKLLIFRGADTTDTDKDGKTFLRYANSELKSKIESICNEYKVALKNKLELHLISDINSIVIGYIL